MKRARERLASTGGDVKARDYRLMTIYQIDPTQDRRWPRFLRHHPGATIFHTPEWLDALQRTYGYEPVVLTTAPPGRDLGNGLAFCRVKSWLTGYRMISTPFSDHCQPLVQTAEEFQHLLSGMIREPDASRAKYIEIRPITLLEQGVVELGKSESFYLHQLDLSPALMDLFGRFHKDCIQRKIHRAEREGLSYEEGTSRSQLARFYQLMVLTRRRQQLLPQPIAWFRNLIACMGDRAKIRLVSKDGRPIAGILTLRYKGTLVYKYGCSDSNFSRFGGTHFLLWQAIQEGKNAALTHFDFGRSNCDNAGLIKFKDRWGAGRVAMAYWRSGAGSTQPATSGRLCQMARHMIPQMPDQCLSLAGRLIYRHYA